MSLLLLLKRKTTTVTADVGVRSMLAFWMGGAGVATAAGQVIARRTQPNLRGNMNTGLRSNYQ